LVALEGSALWAGHRLVARPELDGTFWTDSTAEKVLYSHVNGILAMKQRFEFEIRLDSVY